MPPPHNRQTLPTMLCSLIAIAGAPLAVSIPLALPAASSFAQTSRTDTDDKETRALKREQLVKLSKPITIDVENRPVEDLFNFIARVTGAEIEPIYLNENAIAEGIDPDTEVTIRAIDKPALIVLERLLARIERAENTGEEYTWQFSAYGTIECGPKSALNRDQRVELYDVSDLLYVVPDFDNAPEFDLQSAVQATSSGGGTSPFTGGGQDQDQLPLAERAEALRELIVATVEPDQWADLGGDGARITIYNQSFVITAPDYIHRQIAGYDFWPAKLQQVRKVKGRQEVRIKPATTQPSNPKATPRKP